MLKSVRVLMISFTVLSCWSGPLFADYTIVFKNGGRITVERYWEENGMVKFNGLGGEVGITRQQIQSILQVGEGANTGLVIAAVQESQPAAETKKRVPGSGVDKLKVTAAIGKLKPLPKIRRFKEKDKEQEDYQSLDKPITEGIKSNTDRQWTITRGTSNPAPIDITILKTQKVIMKRRLDDLNSRLKDAQRDLTRRTAVVKLTTNGRFAGRKETIWLLPGGRKVTTGKVDYQPVGVRRVDVPLPGYSDKERELSRLNNHIINLRAERKRLSGVPKNETWGLPGLS